jgi:hypothetical protein
MDGFPEHVIQDLDDFLVNERVVIDRPYRVPCSAATQPKCLGSAPVRSSDRPGDTGMRVSWIEPHDNVVRLHERYGPLTVPGGDIDCWQGTLTDDDRVHELDRHVLSVRNTAARSEREQTAPAGESPSHFVTCRCELIGLPFEKPPGHLIAIGQLTLEHVMKGIHR